MLLGAGHLVGPCWAALVLAAAIGGAHANDTTAELAAGGLVFVSSDHVAMQSEDLFLSASKVKVDYVFHNDGDKDVTSVVAFPMPDVEGNGDFMIDVPDETHDNFMDFSVTADGQPIAFDIDRHAFAAEVDITGLLTAARVPLLPYGAATSKALAQLPKEKLLDFKARGMIVDMSGNGTFADADSIVPVWRLKTTYWWRMTFPAGRDVHVSHVYKPSVGSTAGLNFVAYQGKRFSGEAFETASRRYCFDDGFIAAVGSRLDAAGKDEVPLAESWMSYILTTGENWGGTIGRFHLTVDKETPDTLISLCADGLRKTGPTTFEMSATDFYPEHDLDILFLRKPDR